MTSCFKKLVQALVLYVLTAVFYELFKLYKLMISNQFIGSISLKYGFIHVDEQNVDPYYLASDKAN